MPDTLTDKKITQDEANCLMAPMELDLTALMNIIKQDIISGMEGYEGTPEQYIEEVLNNLKGPGETGEMAIMKEHNATDMLREIQRMLFKAFPPGTRRKRKDGIYEKQPNGKWLKITEGKKEEKKEEKKINIAGTQINIKEINSLKQLNESTIDNFSNMIVNNKEINEYTNDVNNYNQLNKMYKKFDLSNENKKKFQEGIDRNELIDRNNKLTIRDENDYNRLKTALDNLKHFRSQAWEENEKNDDIQGSFHILNNEDRYTEIFNELSYNQFMEFLKISHNLKNTQTKLNKNPIKEFITELEGPTSIFLNPYGSSDINNKDYLKQKIKENIKQEKAGGHWGSADKENITAESIALVNGNGKYRPIEELGNKNYKHKFKLTNIMIGMKLRNYAQNKTKKFSQEKYPFVYRGMMLNKNDIENLIKSKEKNIQMTGSTAFSFYKEIADHYKSSSWTENISGGDSIPVLFKIKRDNKFDNSIGMWHEKYDSETDIKGEGENPAFEIVSGINELKITNILKKTDEKGNIYYEIEGNA